MTTEPISTADLRRRAMAPVDVAWLRMEHPTNLMMVTALLSFDRVLTLERLRQTVEQKLLRYRRFRERVVERGGLPVRPGWQIDPHFDLRSHLLRIALPAPGDEDALRVLVSQLMSTPLDPTKPLWQFHLIDGFHDGSALLARIHHCVADGIALMRLLLSLTDETPASAEAGPPEPTPGLLTAAVTRLQHDLDLLVHPGRLLRLARRGMPAATRLLLRPRDPRTVLRGKLGVQKLATWSAALSLDEVKSIGRITGSTVNDVLLAALTGALRRYLELRGEETTGVEIRAAIPVNLRRPDDVLTLGNRFGLVFVKLPVGIGDPLERIFTVRRRMRELKDSAEAAVVLQLLGTVGRVTAEWQRKLVELVGSKASAVITNVPGPRHKLTLGGVQVRSIMFWVPMSGRVGLGISILSYAGSVRLGIASDAGLVPDPESIAVAFQEEFATLLELTRIPVATGEPPDKVPSPAA